MVLLFFGYQDRGVADSEYLFNISKSGIEKHFLLIMNSAGSINVVENTFIGHARATAQSRGFGKQKFLLCLRFDHIVALNIASAGFYSVMDSTIQLDFGFGSKVVHGFKRNSAVELISAKFGFKVVTAYEMHVLLGMLQA